MTIRICMAGATGWAGSEVARRILNAEIARRAEERELDTLLFH